VLIEYLKAGLNASLFKSIYQLPVIEQGNVPQSNVLIVENWGTWHGTAAVPELSEKYSRGQANTTILISHD
jgi:hypothetical protein